MKSKIAFIAGLVVVMLVGGWWWFKERNILPLRNLWVKPSPAPTSIRHPEAPSNSTAAWDLPKTATASAALWKPTKVRVVKGVSTKKVTTTVLRTTNYELRNSLFDVSFDKLMVTNFPGQSLEKELVIYNRSDKPVLYAARAEQRPGETVPVMVNGSFEATGKMLPLSQEVVKIKVSSNDKNPNFAYNVVVNFMTESGSVVATKTVRIVAYTPIGDRKTLESEGPDQQSMEITYKPNAAYPIRIMNHNQRDLNFTAKVTAPDAAGKLVLSVSSGFIKAGEWWDTDIHFTDQPLNGLTRADVVVTFTALNNDPYSSTKTLTVNVK